MSIKEALRKRLTEAGASAVGFAKAGPVGEREEKAYRAFLTEGRQAGMDYLARNAALRSDPRTLLEGARTVISLAFSYWPGEEAASHAPVALYALGRDYHKAVRKVLRPICREMESSYGCHTRICVDSAPLAERYWAWQAGLGIKGLNGCLIVPGAGSYVVLAEILTTLEINPDEPLQGDCGSCGACLRACPTGALGTEGVDARKCLSYLTIEHKGDWPAGTDGKGSLFGCDRCQTVCPHNRRPAAARLSDFAPRPEVMALTARHCLDLTDEEFASRFAGSPLARAGAEGMRRNAAEALRNTNQCGGRGVKHEVKSQIMETTKKHLYIISFGDSNKYRLTADSNAQHIERLDAYEKELSAYLHRLFPGETFAYFTTPKVEEIIIEHADQYASYPELDDRALEEIKNRLKTEVENREEQDQLDSDAPFNDVAPKY